MKYIFLSITIAATFLSFSQEVEVVDLTMRKEYSYMISELEIVNQSIYAILEVIFKEKEKCENVIDSIYVINVLPIQGNFFIGGLRFSRLDDVLHDFNRQNAKGFFRYKETLFIVYSSLKEDFHPFHWAFVNTDKREQISFFSDVTVYEGYEKQKKMSWWYLYFILKDEFKLSYYIDCEGNEHFIDKKDCCSK